MYSIVKKLRELEPYEPISGDYRIRLDANESFISVDKEKISALLKDEILLNRYPDPYAEKTVNAFARLYGIDENVVTAGNGSDELISIITASFLEKGDKTLCFSPDFSMYAFYPYINELQLETFEKDADFLVDFDAVTKYINDNNVKCLMFSNPCNPTSVGFKANNIRRLVMNTDALIVLDEAYMEFYDEEESLLRETEKYENLIVLKTCSKALALAGIRLGFAVSNAKLTKALKAAKSPYNVNVLTQEIGAYVLSDDSQIKKNIELIKQSITELSAQIINGNYPFFERIYDTNTNFIFIKAKNAEEIYKYLLEKSIAVRRLGGYLRITCGNIEENRELINAINEYAGCYSG